jgi:SNF2 family DNA or RNA helicase
MNITRWQHQIAARQAAQGMDCYGLFFEQGCGKSAALIDILTDLYKVQGQLSTLILCPPIVVENWKREFARFSDVKQADIHCLKGSSFDRICDFERFVEVSPHNRIVVTNYEALLTGLWDKKLAGWKPKVVVLDESHKCKDGTAKRTKKVLELAKTARFRYILSGTPVVNGLEDIFSQFLFLDRGELLGTDFWQFRRKYFVDRNANRPRQNYFPDWAARPDAAKEINKIIFQKSMRVRKDEALDLPPYVRQIVDIDLEGEQKKAYADMASCGVTRMAGNVSSADLSIKRALKLQQIVSGYLPMDDGSIYEFEKNPRINALSELLDTIGPSHKVIVWAVFKQNYRAIAGLLNHKKISYCEIHGGTPEAKRQGLIDAFEKSDSGPRVLIGHPRSVGIGVNLTVADYAVFFTRDFSLENDLQAEARNYRGGSEKHSKITRLDIVAKGTIDELVLVALQEKQDVSEVVLKYMKGNQK